MPLWFAIFVAVWAVVSVLAAVVVGAFIMYCRDARANPLAQLRSGIFTVGDELQDGKKRDDQRGFYE
jgi:hypothetical protein